MTEPVPGIVLDTNIVLDLLVFKDPLTLPLCEALEAGQLRWLSTDAMREELDRVLAYPPPPPPPPRLPSVLRFTAWTRRMFWRRVMPGCLPWTPPPKPLSPAKTRTTSALSTWPWPTGAWC